MNLNNLISFLNPQAVNGKQSFLSGAFMFSPFFPTAKYDERHHPTYLNHYHLSSAHNNHIWFYGE